MSKKTSQGQAGTAKNIVGEVDMYNRLHIQNYKSRGLIGFVNVFVPVF